MPRTFVLTAGLLLALLLNTSAHADISFDGYTRFIYAADQRQLPVILVNDSHEPALVQVKLAWGDAAQTPALPMAVSKPLLLIPAQSNASIDIFYEGEGLPTDRESYLLLKVLQVPKKSGEENLVQIALQHNLKLFYRPKLSSPAEAAVETLLWSQTDSTTYQARNNSPYYLTLTDVGLVAADGTACGKAVEQLMIAPFSTDQLPTATCAKPVHSVTYSVISDSGMPHAYRNNLH